MSQRFMSGNIDLLMPPSSRTTGRRPVPNKSATCLTLEIGCRTSHQHRAHHILPATTYNVVLAPHHRILKAE